MRRRSLSLCLAALGALAVTALAPAGASADSIAYVKGNDVWVSSPDGARSVQVTHGRKFASPSQADDGTIVAIGDDNELWRFAQDGSQPSAPFLTWLGLNGGSGFAGPYAARVSPDGTKVAFTFSHTQGLDQVTGTSTTEGGVSYTAADHATGEHELGLVKGWHNPAWIDNAHVMAFDPGASSLGVDGVTDVVFHELGHADPAADDDLAHVYHWFSDPEAGYPQFGAMSRRGDRLAIGSGGFVTTESLRLYTVAATPPAPASQSSAPQLACRLQDGDKGYQNVSWSPDGSRLAYESGGNIYVVTVGDLSAGCPAVGAPRLLAAGGTSPSWGPADVRAASAPGAGRSSGSRCTVPRLRARRSSAPERSSPARTARCASRAAGARRAWSSAPSVRGPAPGCAEAGASPSPCGAPGRRDRSGWRRQAHLQQAEADFDPLPFDAPAARALGRVAASLRRAGHKTAARAYDAMIAATAVANELPLYTCNPADFTGIDGLTVVTVPEPETT